MLQNYILNKFSIWPIIVQIVNRIAAKQVKELCVKKLLEFDIGLENNMAKMTLDHSPEILREP